VSVAYLDRPVYGMAQVDSLLGLRPGTAARWIDGYVRGGRHYPPVVREVRTGDDVVTWGEFVETRLLAGYRNEGVPMLRMRPIVENLRTTFGVRYPLAHAKPYIDAGRLLVYRVQEDVGLEESMRLVVEASSNQLLLAHPTREFFANAEFDVVDGEFSESVVTRLRPLGPARSVVIDPDRSFGLPSVRSVATEVLAELIRAGDPIEMVADLYELSVDQVLDALEYEKREKAA
jgi:uncharacterized protein (DUF433 family)